jgi:hypothetical protein
LKKHPRYVFYFYKECTIEDRLKKVAYYGCLTCLILLFSAQRCFSSDKNFGFTLFTAYSSGFKNQYQNIEPFPNLVKYYDDLWGFGAATFLKWRTEDNWYFSLRFFAGKDATDYTLTVSTVSDFLYIKITEETRLYLLELGYHYNFPLTPVLSIRPAVYLGGGTTTFKTVKDGRNLQETAGISWDFSAALQFDFPVKLGNFEIIPFLGYRYFEPVVSTKTNDLGLEIKDPDPGQSGNFQPIALLPQDWELSYNFSNVFLGIGISYLF